jgi:hypothetical protein
MVGLRLTVVTQNVGRRTPCRPECQAKVGETYRLALGSKARVGRSERSPSLDRLEHFVGSHHNRAYQEILCKFN